ncbi:DUF2235 domain-containing protein [Arenibacterium sp. LLYu02]|uniref:DUF2235 domain-containing protein n=1 Tax=Arenibacterium sp. LLYu02 TaxID=3404132 RepID=UPI003B210B97
MRRLILCCDGTWNTADQQTDGLPTPTNVAKIYSLLARDEAEGVQQVTYYRNGVGTSGGVFRRTLGGAIGLRLEDDIVSAYKFLAETYAPGDEICLFGFSRGAYTVRSLAGMVSNVGLADLRPDHLASGVDPWEVVKRLMTRYQSNKAGADKSAVQSLLLTPAPVGDVRFHAPEGVGFRFIGVWDTVGALGIPDDKGVLRFLLGDPKKHGFKDTELGANVRTARHALAMDERRQDFTPTLWTKWAEGQDVEQRWFAGVHGDVGGSYGDCGLGDLTLDWMITEAGKAGVRFRAFAPGQVRPDAFARRHDSFLGVFRRRPSRPRAVPQVKDWAPGEGDHLTRFDPSVIARHLTPPPGEVSYWPTQMLLVGEGCRTRASAKPRWNATGLYLVKGASYYVTAKGEWLDAGIKADANGPKPGFQLAKAAYGLAKLPEALRGLLRKSERLAKADVTFSRRVVEAPWFALMGAIGSGRGNTEVGGGIEDHDTHLLGTDKTFTARESGYLYLFANDAWVMYGNNAGSLEVEITRLS